MWFYHLTWHRHTRSASVANISTTFPFPSSPHWAPSTTVTLAISDLPRLWGKITPFTLFDILPAYKKIPTHSCTHLQIEKQSCRNQMILLLLPLSIQRKSNRHFVTSWPAPTTKWIVYDLKLLQGNRTSIFLYFLRIYELRYLIREFTNSVML